MDEIDALRKQLADSIKQHQDDAAHLERLLTIENHLGGDGCGKTIMDLCNGDWDEAKRFIETSHTRTNLIYRRWAILARLTYLESKGEVK